MGSAGAPAHRAHAEVVAPLQHPCRLASQPAPSRSFRARASAASGSNIDALRPTFRPEREDDSRGSRAWLQQPSKRASRRHAAAPMYIALDALAVAFGGDRIFSDLTLTIAQGEFVCLLGPSGCGKSTLIRIIGGLIDPSAGARDRGRPARREAARNTLAYVFQSPRLVPWRNALDNVGARHRAAHPVRGQGRAACSARASSCEMVGLGRRCRQISRPCYPAASASGSRSRARSPSIPASS